ncbi:MAG: ATP-binding protein [Lachnospiraceae bacterium]|nr:ATP-binding protein [Lachnospiraceae bacterium]
MIPIKIETLLEGRKVEQNRIEYKEGFNPSDIVHTICAYANDISGMDGGYLVTYWHSGINPGFQSLFVLYPLQDKYVLVLTNSDNGLSFAKETAKAFFGIDGYWDIKR